MTRANGRLALRASRNILAMNGLLAALKLAAGLASGSAALVSDAAHSLSDAFSTVVVMIGVKLSGKKSDKEHPYGHERLECVAAILVAFIIGLAGFFIGWGGLQKIAAEPGHEMSAPGAAALAVALFSIAAKECMFRYARAAARTADSSALHADAWHHRSDALSSAGGLAGVLGARLGAPVLDAVACVVISLFILKAAVDIFRDACCKMIDRACDDAFVAELRAEIAMQAPLQNVGQIRTRLFGERIYVDVEISADGSLTLNEAHGTARRVRDAIERRFVRVKRCTVQVHPAPPP